MDEFLIVDNIVLLPFNCSAYVDENVIDHRPPMVWRNSLSYLDFLYESGAVAFTALAVT